MGEKENRHVIERLIQCINDKRVEVMDELFHDDALIEYPQSRERVSGAANRRLMYGSFPGLPTITPRQMVSGGDLVVAEAAADYGSHGDFQTVFIYELRAGSISKETVYWSKSFDAPEWRAAWVERM